MEYTTRDFERAHTLNKIAIIVLFSLFLATAILSTMPGFIDAVCSIFGGK